LWLPKSVPDNVFTTESTGYAGLTLASVM